MLHTYPPSAFRHLGVPVSDYREWLRSALLDGNTVADYDASLGITGALNVSAWANQIGAAGPLLQATGANQPIHLLWTGENHLWLPGVVGNRATTPDAAVLRITGDIDIRVYLAMDDWTPSTIGFLVNKLLAAGQYGYDLLLNTNGTIRLRWSTDGTALISQTSDTTGLSTGTAKWIRATLDVDNGAGGYDVKFWTSDDNISYSQLGSTLTGASTTSIFAGDAVLAVGDNNLGQAVLEQNKFYRAQIYNGIAGTLVFDADFTRVPEGATSFTESSSNAATVTINSTGSKPAQIVGSPSLLFDGAAHFMQATASATDYSIYKVINLRSWTDTDALLNVLNGGTVGVYQSTGTPSIRWQSTGNGTGNTNLTLGAWHILTVTKSGTTFTVAVDGTTVVTDTLTDAALDRYTLGAIDSGLGQWSNIQEKRDIARNVADSAAQQATIQALLKAIYGTP